MQAAYSSYKQVLQSNDIRLGFAAYHMAVLALTDGRHEGAIEYLNESLVAFASDEEKVGAWKEQCARC